MPETVFIEHGMTTMRIGPEGARGERGADV